MNDRARWLERRWLQRRRLERRRQALTERDRVIGAEAARAHAAALVGEAVAALAGALGPGKYPVCRRCRRAVPPDRRTCPHCGAKDRNEEGGGQ
jgi:hypothetical protein